MSFHVRGLKFNSNFKKKFQNSAQKKLSFLALIDIKDTISCPEWGLQQLGWELLVESVPSKREQIYNELKEVSSCVL